jgi:protein O-mannosyl-transferase
MNKTRKAPGNKRDANAGNRPASKSSQNKIYKASAVAAILLVTWIVFSPALKNDFVNSWDDGLNIRDNYQTSKFDFQTVKNIFKTPVGGSYIPLVITSFAWERSKTGLNPWLFHFDNLLLHLVCTWLVYYLMLVLTGQFWMSAFIALLFGIHPMHVESVAWVTERKDVLYGMFYLSSLLCYVKMIRSPGQKLVFYLLSLALFILSLLSKIQAVSLPLAMFAIDYLLKRKLNFKLIAEKLPFLLLSVAIGLVGVSFLSSEKAFDAQTNYPLLQRIFLGSYAYCVYMVKSVVPYELSALYSYPKTAGGMLPWLYYASVIPVIAIMIFVVIRFRKSRESVFGMVFFTVNIVFLLQILGAGKAFMADRFSYISYLGLFFIFGDMLFRKIKSKRIQTGAIALSLVVLVIYSEASYARCLVWRNSETLWTDVIKKYPEEAPAYNNRGIYYRETGRNDLAFADYSRVISITPGYGRAYLSRGNIYFDNKQYGLALADYNEAQAKGVSAEQLFANRGAVWSLNGEYQKALDDFEHSLAINPYHANAYKSRAICRMYMKEYNLALDDFEKYLSITPGDDDVFNSMAVCYQYLNQIDESLVWFGKAISIKPSGGYFYNRSISYLKKGDKANALKDALEARRRGQPVSDDYIQKLQ